MCVCVHACVRVRPLGKEPTVGRVKRPRLSVESRQKGGLGGGESRSKGGWGAESARRPWKIPESRVREGGSPGVNQGLLRERETQREKEEQQEGPTGMEKPEQGLPWVVEDSVAGGLLKPKRNGAGAGVQVRAELRGAGDTMHRDTAASLQGQCPC